MESEFGQFRNTFHYMMVPDLTGRPNRQNCINKEDQINLAISLALSKDVLDFLNDRHIF